MAAEEPVHVEALDHLIKCSAVERKRSVAKLSMLFRYAIVSCMFFIECERLVGGFGTEDETCYVDVDDVHERLGMRCHDVLKDSLTFNDKQKVEDGKGVGVFVEALRDAFVQRWFGESGARFDV